MRWKTVVVGLALGFAATVGCKQQCFITEPDMDPTNNLAEQAIRFVAIHRRMTQGTRGEKGQHWCERLWTVAATCVQQGRSVFGFLLEAVQAHFQGDAFPSLLTNSS